MKYEPNLFVSKGGQRLLLTTLMMVLAGCGDGQQSDLSTRLKALLGGGSANPTAAAPDPQQVLQKELDELRKKADAGDAEAQYKVGQRHHKGDGVPKDSAKAVEWFQKATAQGLAVAQFSLGVAYAEDDGVTKDLAKALEWYQKAANQGNAWAQNNLAGMYIQGIGVPKDEGKAAELFRQAAVQGLAGAQLSLGGMYRYGMGVPKDAGKALEWLQKGVAQGHAGAQIELGEMYRLGEGVPEDQVRAAQLFQIAAEQGNMLGQEKIALAYDLGSGVPKDKAKAVEWHMKAASQGSGDSQGSLAEDYLNGWGVQRDVVLAYAWMNLAASGTDKSSIWTLLAQRRRSEIEQQMTPAELAEAQRLSSGWKAGMVLARGSGTAGAGKQPASPGGLAKKNTGTAFIVNAAGHAITNHHVVQGCAEVRAEGREGAVKVVTSDVVNDLALLQIPGGVAAQATISSDPAKLRQGEDIVVFGFPLNAVLSSGGNLTPGVVSAVTGLGNNTNQIQITAPIQPGSSGSPVINKKGEVVGVVSMKLSDAKMAKATGQIGQNVNFAVSGQTLKTFLDTHKVEYRSSGMFSFGSKSTTDLADEARKWTLVVECWK